jgi:CubicO group peptidase (beta-lactamase class C family)
MPPRIDDLALRAGVDEILGRFPAAGLAVGVVCDGSLAWFHGHGLADVASRRPVTRDTVFPIASITKTFTAIAVLQLWERGLLDLDAPANDHLRGFRLVPSRAGFPPATVRHLLTHTAGVRAVRTAADVLRPEMGWRAPAGRPAPSLAEYYRGGLRYDTAPGTRWAYSNHGYATLGQIVADVAGLPFDRYLRQNVLEPLGMDDSDAVLSERLRPRLATGYTVTGGGVAAVSHHEIVTAGGSAVYSTTADMARYAAALLGGGAGLLRPETLATMFAPQYQPDPRLSGMGLGFFREELGGHRIVAHDGILTGYRTDMRLAPDDGIGVVVMANSGGFDPRGVSVPVSLAMLRLLLDLPDDVVPTGAPERPWVWSTCAAGTRSGRGSSPTLNPGWRSEPGSRWSSAAGTCGHGAGCRSRRLGGGSASTPKPTTRTPSASTSPCWDWAPHRWCSAVIPTARWRPCTWASSRCRSASAPTCATRDDWSAAHWRPAPPLSPCVDGAERDPGPTPAAGVTPRPASPADLPGASDPAPFRGRCRMSRGDPTPGTVIGQRSIREPQGARGCRVARRRSMAGPGLRGGWGW